MGVRELPGGAAAEAQNATNSVTLEGENEVSHGRGPLQRPRQECRRINRAQEVCNSFTAQKKATRAAGEGKWASAEGGKIASTNSLPYSPFFASLSAIFQLNPTVPGANRLDRVHRITMKGLTWKSLKANPSLMPLFLFVGLGSAMAALYVLRLATQHPEVSWSRKDKGRPFDAYDGKQYKFFAQTVDYKNLPPSPAPKLD
ncbi:hypothetical protein BV898_06223 [Hypsibius exemplaris]|uniref:Cytochrome c oxidase subunit NDUFA4 n=1 Tax=Hypsibius exemplaris TaxID=2072580 RepID=A0A1W0WWV8_HYPEX|nr:hypothetical protein BV898_06223 [Hypsibius exemplaris]